MSYGGSGNPYGNSPQQYPAPYGGGSYDEEHELQSYGSPSQPLNGGGPGGEDDALPVVDFLNRITELRTQIGAIEGNTEALRRVQDVSMQQSDSTQARGQIEQMTADLRQQIRAIKDELTVKLADDASRTSNSGEFATKKSQLEAAVNSFKAAAQRFREVEEEFRRKFRDQLVRQYQIVNPGSSEPEAERFIDNSDNQNMFEQAVQNSRAGQARTVLGNVRARHDELLRIEQSIMELAEMFQDLDRMVVVQRDIVQQVYAQAGDINQNFEVGKEEVDKGIKSAKNRRKLKWWCLLVVVLIIIAIALGVGLGIALNRSPSSNNNNNGNNGSNSNNNNNNNANSSNN